MHWCIPIFGSDKVSPLFCCPRSTPNSNITAHLRLFYAQCEFWLNGKLTDRIKMYNQQIRSPFFFQEAPSWHGSEGCESGERYGKQFIVNAPLSRLSGPSGHRRQWSKLHLSVLSTERQNIPVLPFFFCINLCTQPIWAFLKHTESHKSFFSFPSGHLNWFPFPECRTCRFLPSQRKE